MYRIEDFTVTNTFEQLVDDIVRAEAVADGTLVCHGLPVDPLIVELRRREARRESAPRRPWLSAELGPRELFDLPETQPFLQIKVPDVPIKMHTANAFLNALVAARKGHAADEPLLVHSVAGNWQQWIGVSGAGSARNREYVAITDATLRDLLERVHQVAEHNRPLSEYLSSRLKLELSRHCTTALLHYIFREQRLPLRARLFEGYNVVRIYNPYALYALDAKLAELFATNYKPFRSIFLVNESHFTFDPTVETVIGTFLQVVPSNMPEEGSIALTLRTLQEYTTLVPDPVSENSGIHLSDKHFYPSQVLLEDIFINDNCDNNVSLGLAALLQWSLKFRQRCSLQRHIWKMRGLMTTYHKRTDWLRRLATKITRSRCDVKAHAACADDDCVVLFDRILMCYVKLCLFTTLQYNDIAALAPYRYSILNLLLLVPSLSYRNLLLNMSKRNHAEGVPEMAEYRTVSTAIKVNQQLGGAIEEVKNELLRIYGQTLVTPEGLRCDDLFLSNEYQERSEPPTFDDIAQGIADRSSSVSDRLQLDFDDLRNQYEFELEDSFSELCAHLADAEKHIYNHAVGAFRKIVAAEVPVEARQEQIVEAIGRKELADVKYRFLRSMLNVKNLTLSEFAKAIENGSEILLPKTTLSSLLIDRDEHALVSLLPQMPMESLSFMHLIVDDHAAVYSFRNAKIATVAVTTTSS